MKRAGAALLALALAACGAPPREEARAPDPRFNAGAPTGVCALADLADVGDALGATVTKTVGEVASVEACLWYAEEAQGGLRTLRLERWRGADVLEAGAGLSLADFYDRRIAALPRTGKRIAALNDLGLAAVMGLSPHGGAGFDAEILIRREADVLILTAGGEDAEALEKVARALGG